MAKLQATPELIEGILQRIPEGFIHQRYLNRRIRINHKNDSIHDMLQPTSVDFQDKHFYDTSRIQPQQIKDLKTWCQPEMPHIGKDGTFQAMAIPEREVLRAEQISALHDPISQDIVNAIAATSGYIEISAISKTPDDQLALEDLLDMGILLEYDDFVYDPLRVGERTMEVVARRHELEPAREEITEFITAKPGQTAARDELEQKFSAKLLNDVMQLGGFSNFSVKIKGRQESVQWIRLKGSDQAKAREAADEAVQIPDTEWEEARQRTGDTLRSGARDGESFRVQVVARSYTVNRAAKDLQLKQGAIESAIADGHLAAFTDPEDRVRLPAEQIEAARQNTDQHEQIAGYETLRVRELATALGTSYSTARRKLKRIHIHHTNPEWREIRGRWSLPDSYFEFREIIKTRIEEKRAAQKAKREEEERRIQEEMERERKRREELRARLVASFPSWRHERRVDQHISLHIGPPNSGKTHDSLTALTEAETGWYLAPLRLLAHEIFDRLNQRGVPCNLLTGEEHIPVDGASITAATIEMFNPHRSGNCVIIDEAQMLADMDRGWAWTRALMEAESPEIHVIAPDTAQDLITKLADAAAIPTTLYQHQRLAPIKVADNPWPLEDMPPQTILVAFSRRMVLQLKTELERMGRTVSVVYGGLPPEVRRRQADRFAEGETEICIATDAVGMGLNLPADQVCFFEVEKYDGQDIRPLTPTEVHQIGGRAGRYGISKSGEIGATTTKNLKQIRRMFETPPEELTFAHVAPTVEDLEMIPGTLAEQLDQWAALESIPESLHNVLKTANLAERVELASMLTDEEVDQLGISAALTLVNAPTRQSSRAFWYSCAQAILRERYFPLPPPAPTRIKSGRDLETTEQCIACADIYLWLSHRREFREFGEREQEVRSERMEWSTNIDKALLEKLVITRQCSRCGKELPREHRYAICDNCFRRRR